MLQGRANRDGYALFLRNLLPAYQALEYGLERGRSDPSVKPLAQPPLYRAPALERDLAVLCGERAGWPAVLPSGAEYGARVAEASASRLLAHAYVRYLGDLSGGRILGRLLARAPGLPAAALSFYDFPAIPDTDAFRDTCRTAIDRTLLSEEHIQAALDEACRAFEHNIRVSEEVSAAIQG
jgi:heme oxygenase